MEALLLGAVTVALVGYAWWSFHAAAKNQEEEAAFHRSMQSYRERLSEEESDE